MVNEGKYLMFEERNTDCVKIAEYLTERGISFTKVPCVGLAEPQLVVGRNTFNGLERIKVGIEAKLARGELESRN